MTRSTLIFLLCLAAASLNAAWKPGDALDRILVLWKAQPSEGLRQAEIRRLGLTSPKADPRSALHALAGGTPIRQTPLLDIEIVALPAARSGADVDRALAVYQASGLVQAAEPDAPVRMAAAAWPDDPAFVGGRQVGLTQTAWTQAWAAWKAGAIVLHSVVTVAVLDTGVDAHTDFADGQRLTGASFVDSEADSSDNNGHGTFVAGLIAASPANGSGIAGAFFDPAYLHLLPVKVLSGCGEGSYSSLSAGLLYAVDQGAQVVNMSIEASDPSDIFAEAVLEADRRGVVVVAAAGNDFGAAVGWPAAYPSVISVGALTTADLPTDYTNAGKVDISAPGGAGAPGCHCLNSPVGCPSEIWSLSAQYIGCSTSAASFGDCNMPYSLSGYEAAAGTSFASPLVAAAAALILSQSPGLAPKDVLQRLIQGASATAEGSGFHKSSGWGKLNFKGALTVGADSGPTLGFKAWNWPNPFSPVKDGYTTFNIQLDARQDLTLRLLDAGGDLVKSWQIPAASTWIGSNFVQWDGRNGAGRDAANGSYLLVVEGSSGRATHRVALLR